MKTENSETKPISKSDEKCYVRGGKKFTLPVTTERMSEIALS